MPQRSYHKRTKCYRKGNKKKHKAVEIYTVLNEGQVRLTGVKHEWPSGSPSICNPAVNEPNSGRRRVNDARYATRIAPFTISPHTRCQGILLVDHIPCWQSLCDTQGLAHHFGRSEAKELNCYDKNELFAMLEFLHDREAASEMPKLSQHTRCLRLSISSAPNPP